LTAGGEKNRGPKENHETAMVWNGFTGKFRKISDKTVRSDGFGRLQTHPKHLIAMETFPHESEGPRYWLRLVVSIFKHFI